MVLKCVDSRIAAVVAMVLCGAGAIAQSVETSRITQAVDNTRRLALAGNVHPKAVAAALAGNDLGRVAPSLEIPYITLSLAPSAKQQADLEKLLLEQQTPGSPRYHQWLTPEEFGQSFGVSDDDLAKVTRWLQEQGLQVLSVARGRQWIAARGTAAQLEAAFQTEIHQYLADGETHFANASAPSVPAAFGSVVTGVRGLNDFHPKPHLRASPAKSLSSNTAKYNSTYCDENCLAPDDFATIYDVTPLYSAGINGAGQKIAIAGQIEVNLSDIEQFRSMFNLPANDPETLLVPGSQSPGNSNSGDLAESDLDLEWSGAVARNATIIFVYSNDVMTSVQYAIDQKLAAVVSVSYGSCEPETAASEYNAFVQWGQQANAQGMTWFAASGDDGAADCNDNQNPGLAVDLPGSTPYVTSVGGTEFMEGAGIYWSATDNANGASALSYIPEMTWNDSVADGEPSASGGGGRTEAATNTAGGGAMLGVTPSGRSGRVAAAASALSGSSGSVSVGAAFRSGGGAAAWPGSSVLRTCNRICVPLNPVTWAVNKSPGARFGGNAAATRLPRMLIRSVSPFEGSTCAVTT